LDDGRAVLESVELRSKYHPHALIAAESNSITRSVQAVVRAENVVQLSPIASTDALSSKDDAPLFARTGPKEFDYGNAMASYVAHYGWQNVAVLSSLDDYGAESAKSFISAAPDVRILEHASFRYLTGNRQTVKLALQDLQESKARIILTFASAEHFPHIFREAEELGMLKYPFVWILGEQAVLSNTFVQNVTFPDGVVAVAPHEGGTAVFERFASDMESRVRDVPYLASDFFIGSAEVYDIFQSLARSYHAVASAGGNLLNGSAVYRSLLNVPIFTGASGRVAFDARGDRLYGSIDFFNRVDGQWRSVAIWRNESNDTELIAATFTVKAETIFLNGIRTPPTDLERLYANWSDGGGLSMTLITALLLLIVVGSSAVVMRYRHNPLIRASSPFFLLATLVGIALALMSNFFMIGLPTRACGTRYWLLLLGFGTIF
jgi:ABC-type branched-subunit amino acid transport system substrate-binding protein